MHAVGWVVAWGQTRYEHEHEREAAAEQPQETLGLTLTEAAVELTQKRKDKTRATDLVVLLEDLDEAGVVDDAVVLHQRHLAVQPHQRRLQYVPLLCLLGWWERGEGVGFVVDWGVD